jgi:hypothetical protein
VLDADSGAPSGSTTRLVEGSLGSPLESSKRPTSVVLRYRQSPLGGRIEPLEPASIDGEPALAQPPDFAYAEVAWIATPDAERCEIAHASTELRGMLRVIRLNFVGLLQSLGAVTQERALEIVSNPLVEPPARD